MRSGVGSDPRDPLFITPTRLAVDANGSATRSATEYSALGYQQLSSAQLATAQALAVPANATAVVVQNNGTQPIRWRPDGSTTAPTVSVGLRIRAGDEMRLVSDNVALTAMRFIREADGATLDVVFYG